MSDIHSTSQHHRHSRRHRDPSPDSDFSSSSLSSPPSDTAGRATTGRSRSQRKRTTGNALVVREQYHLQQPPRRNQDSEYSDDYEEYVVHAEEPRGGRQQYREKEKDRQRGLGMLLVVVTVLVGLVFCLRETREVRRERRR